MMRAALAFVLLSFSAPCLPSAAWAQRSTEPGVVTGSWYGSRFESGREIDIVLTLEGGAASLNGTLIESPVDGGPSKSFRVSGSMQQDRTIVLSEAAPGQSRYRFGFDPMRTSMRGDRESGGTRGIVNVRRPSAAAIALATPEAPPIRRLPNGATGGPEKVELVRADNYAAYYVGSTTVHIVRKIGANETILKNGVDQYNRPLLSAEEKETVLSVARGLFVQPGVASIAYHVLGQVFRDQNGKERPLCIASFNTKNNWNTSTFSIDFDQPNGSGFGCEHPTFTAAVAVQTAAAAANARATIAAASQGLADSDPIAVARRRDLAQKAQAAKAAEQERIVAARVSLARRHGYQYRLDAYWASAPTDSTFWTGNSAGDTAQPPGGPLRGFFDGTETAEPFSPLTHTYFVTYVEMRSARCPRAPDDAVFTHTKTVTTFNGLGGVVGTNSSSSQIFVKPRLAPLFSVYTSAKQAEPLTIGTGLNFLVDGLKTNFSRLRVWADTRMAAVSAMRWLFDKEPCDGAMILQLEENLFRRAMDTPSVQREKQRAVGSRPELTFYSDRGQLFFGRIPVSAEAQRLPPFVSKGKRFTYQDVVVKWAGGKDMSLSVNTPGLSGWDAVFFQDDAGALYAVWRGPDFESDGDEVWRIRVVKLPAEEITRWGESVETAFEKAKASGALRVSETDAAERDAELSELRIFRVLSGRVGNTSDTGLWLAGKWTLNDSRPVQFADWKSPR